MSAEQVRPGYKLTEVGVIPEEWEIHRLLEVAHVKTGPFGSALHERDYVDDGTPIITVEHLGEHGVRGENVPMVSESDRQRLNAYELRENDVVFSRVGSIDRNALITATEAGWLFSGRLLRVRPDPEKVYSSYLSYHFHTNAFKARVQSVAVGQTMPSLNTQILKNLLVVIPPLPEQRAIAAALGDVDALLAGLERLIAKRRAVKQAAMDALLSGRVRLPGFGQGAGHRQSEVGVIPEDWEVYAVLEVAHVKTGPFGSALHERDYVDDGTPIITVEHLGEYGIHCENIPMVSDVDKQRLGAYELRENDIVFSRVGAIDRNARITAAEAGWLFSGRLLRVRPDPEKVYSPYLSYHFHTDAFKKRVQSVAVGQTMPSLNTQILKNLIVIVPSLPEQRAIAAVLSDMDAAIAALARQRDKVQALKQGMMAELLTGRVRLVKSPPARYNDDHSTGEEKRL